LHSFPTRRSSDLLLFGYFQGALGAESPSVTARLWAAITSRPPSASRIRVPTASRNMRIRLPPCSALLPAIAMPEDMTGIHDSHSTPCLGLGHKFLERLLLLQLGQ